MSGSGVLSTWFETESDPDPDPVDERAHDPRPPRSWGWILVVLIGQALVLFDLSVPVVRPVLAGALLVGVPVLALSRRLAVRLGDPLAAVLYAFGVTGRPLVLIGAL